MSREIPEIKLESIDSLLGCADEDNTSSISLDKVHEFKNHPYQVRNDDSMQKLIRSIEQQGVLVPITVRKSSDGEYEIISGHRRCFAARYLGMTTIPGIIKECSDDEAVIMMVDSNIQREGMLLSEKASAYKLKYESMKHQGKRGGNSLEEMGRVTGENPKTIERIMSLTRLHTSLLRGVDEKRIGLSAGYILSNMSDENMAVVANLFERYHCKITNRKAKQIARLSERNEISEKDVQALLIKDDEYSRSITLNSEIIDRYFPKSMSAGEVLNEICQILDEYSIEEIPVSN